VKRSAGRYDVRATRVELAGRTARSTVADASTQNSEVRCQSISGPRAHR
jgi:hypothetical protein